MNASSETRTPVLEVRGLGVRLRDIAAVDGIDLTLYAGEALALVGESGCGKSLSSLAVMGLLPHVASLAQGSSIILQGQQLAGLDEDSYNHLRGNRMSMIFQEPFTSLNPLMPVGAQITEVLTVHGVPEAEARARALDMLSKVGIPDPAVRFNQFPFELSGGICQRVMIALALVGNPTLLIADEPTTALDVTIQAQILDLMRDLMRERDTALLLITHDMGVVAETADRVAVMYAGRIVELADARTLFTAPRHPYTRLLLESIPGISTPPKTVLRTIAGTVPDIRDWAEGCRFHPRCPFASDDCRKAAPPLEELPLDGRSHKVACWHVNKTELL